MSVVQALTESTKAYLAWMDQQQQVTIVGVVREIAALEEIMIVEGASWTKHTGRTTPGVKLSLDSPLLLRTQGREHEIRLTAHDRTTGLLDFVALDSIKDESGDLVMSFRWLIQHVLNWLERRGACIT